MNTLEEMSHLEELRKQVGEAVKDQEWGKLDWTSTVADLKNKKAILLQLIDAINELNVRKENAEADLNAKNKEIIDGYEQRNNESKAKEAEAQTLLEEARHERNLAAQEKFNAINEKTEAQAIKEDFLSKFEQAKELIAKLGSLLG